MKEMWLDGLVSSTRIELTEPWQLGRYLTSACQNEQRVNDDSSYPSCWQHTTVSPRGYSNRCRSRCTRLVCKESSQRPSTVVSRDVV
eukprot:scaffold14185_cov179-Alexandrium_tamarense.AAC.1